MQSKKTENFLKNPYCLGLYSKEFLDEEFYFDKRIFKFISKVKIPEEDNLIELKFFLKEQIQKVVFTKWSINSVVFVDPSAATCACLVKYIYTDFGQIKHQTAFYIGDSSSKKVWLIR
jgi:hypothetical protein